MKTRPRPTNKLPNLVEIVPDMNSDLFFVTCIFFYLFETFVLVQLAFKLYHSLILDDAALIYLWSCSEAC